MLTFHIKGGPSKMDLMLALFDRLANAGKAREVEFHGRKELHRHELIHDVTMTAIILGVKTDNEMGTLWAIEGRVISSKSTQVAGNMYEPFNFTAYYNTDRRDGVLHAL